MPCRRLAIVARRRSGAAGHSYTSAGLTTSARMAFRYGGVEARIRVPAGQGLWPGFWALGNDVARKGWPRSGEIDIMEVIGSSPWKTHGSIHGRHRTTRSTGSAVKQRTGIR
jgi:beta-glucanase (GH16 family)